MPEILTSKADHAVMAVTIEWGFLPPVCSAYWLMLRKVTRRSAKECRRGYLVTPGLAQPIRD
jgi:hypothetical protein